MADQLVDAGSGGRCFEREYCVPLRRHLSEVSTHLTRVVAAEDPHPFQAVTDGAVYRSAPHLANDQPQGRV